MCIVCPSTWLARQAEKSPLFQDLEIHTVPNAVDCKMFRPLDSTFCKGYFGIPDDRCAVLFAAAKLDNPYKGLHYLIDAINNTGLSRCPVLILVGGGDFPREDLRFPCVHLGNVKDQRLLPLIYSAADLVAVPSVDDVSSNVILEASACGKPAVAFKVGGIPELIHHRTTGLLVEKSNVTELAEGISWLASDSGLCQEYGSRSRERAIKEFSLQVQAAAYDKLIRSMLLIRQ